MPHRICRSNEGEIGNDDLVPFLHADPFECEMERDRPVRHGDGVDRSTERGKALLELVYIAAEGRDPPGIECIQEVLAFKLAERGPGDRDEVHVSVLSPGTTR
jgi:hypothetical protein